ncbi:hypothetical protein ABZ915_30400 [Streptomyces sp. NPDC046915]|uniref:hypothetical protein n=1 Tax=Streptomyces sp. NPDC046915 TaxID=3155257 RepID=UPI0033D196AD
MGSEGQVCPACGQPVETVIRRYKTLGAWVPKWVPGPCRNPDCPANAAAAPEERPGPQAPPENDPARQEPGP